VIDICLAPSALYECATCFIEPQLNAVNDEPPPPPLKPLDIPRKLPVLALDRASLRAPQAAVRLQLHLERELEPLLLGPEPRLLLRS
jgi:hypothetical protein